jgi:hypothetical protein
MQVKNIYPLSITRDYVAAWGLVEAARELIQNALDSDSPFDFTFEPYQTEAGQTLYNFYLRSEFSRLEARHLLLGTSSKANDESKIGSFGEGFKIALLVLTREGYCAAVRNGNVLWTPFFTHNEDFGAEVLAIKEEGPTGIDQGLCFMISGISSEEAGKIRGCCLKMQEETIGETTRTPYGDILHEMPGELYVGSLFICHIPGLQHGYNLKPEHVKLERDRQTVDNWDLKWLLSKVWYSVGKPDVVAQMIYDNVPDVSSCQYNHDEMVKQAAYAIYKEKHPGAILAESPQEMRKMIEQGLVTTIYTGAGFASVVKATDAYQQDRQAIAPRPTSPFDFLTSWFNAHKKGMDAITAKHFKETVLTTAAHWKADA